MKFKGVVDLRKYSYTNRQTFGTWGYERTDEICMHMRDTSKVDM